jgi:hypothetical protein
MGANISNQLAETVNKTVNSTVNNVSKNTKASSTAVNSQINSININGRFSAGGSLVIGQNLTSKIQIITKLKAEHKTSLANDIKNKLKTQVAQIVDQANKDLNLGQVNVSNTVTRVINSIENSTTNNVSSNIESLSSSITTNSNTLSIAGTFNIGKNINITQDSVIDALSKNISNAIVSDAISTSVTSDIATEIKQKATQKNSGINLNFLGAIAGIVAVVGGGGLAAKYMKDKKNKTGNTPDMSSLLEPTKLGAVGGSVGSALKNNWKLISGLIVVITILILMVYFFYVKPRKEKNAELIKFADKVPPGTTNDTLDADIALRNAA